MFFTLKRNFIMKEVSLKIEKIKSVFQETQSYFSEHNNIQDLIGYLDNQEPTYRSIAYESASMAIAMNDFENDTELNTWRYFAEVQALPHQAQVYIGLGWAIAKLNIPFLSGVEKIDKRFYHRIADGCGYYDGSFRQRQTVLSQQIPHNLPVTALHVYDQGIGRSLWYSNNADINKIRSKIDSFQNNRQTDLWRGVGIAIAYVGGCDDNTLKILLKDTVSNSLDLISGAAIAYMSRKQANSLTNDTDRCARLWFDLAKEESNLFSDDSSDLVANPNILYHNWMMHLEKCLEESFTTGSFNKTTLMLKA